MNMTIVLKRCVFASLLVFCLFVGFCCEGPSFSVFARDQAKKEVIVETLAALHRKLTNKKLGIQAVPDAELKELTVTQDQAKEMTREDIQRRKAALVAQAHDSDTEEGSVKNASQDMEQLMDSSEKVNINDFDLLKVHCSLCNLALFG
jgi:hypothetical protein